MIDSVTEKPVTPKKKTGAPLGNKNAAGYGAPVGNQNVKGNKGGPGGPYGNDKATKHGFFKKIFPDDEETMEILLKSPLDMLWENIII